MPARRAPAPRPAANAVILRLRRATSADVELLVRHRRLMWLAIGGRFRARLAPADPAYRHWVRRELAARHFLAFVVETTDGRPAGSGAIWLRPAQPRPGRRFRARMPYILSMYTELEFRGRGVASRIVREQIAWAKAQGYPRLTLHASEQGRPVYAGLGFQPTNEMRLDLPAPRPRTGRRALRRRG
ncbi:MAG: GNAT family N-acetyltransferase [Thermoplasmata archaeon]